MNARSTLCAALLLASLPAWSQLVLSSSRFQGTYGVRPQALNNLEDPHRLLHADPRTELQADLASGVLRAWAYSGDAWGEQALAEVWLRVTLDNTGTEPLRFAPGALSAQFNARFERTLGPDAQGMAENSFLALLGAQINGSSLFGFSSMLVIQRDTRTLSGDLSVVRPSTAGGFSWGGVADANGVDLLFSAPEFVMPAGTQLWVDLRLSALAAAGTPAPADNWTALTDAAHSARLSLQLPAGVTLNSPVPLGWVSAVPEPGSALLWLGGLALFFSARRARS